MQDRLKNRKALIRTQREIFDALKREANALFGAPPESIRKYEREYNADFLIRSRLKTISKDTLFDRIESAEVVFIADYHPFSQSQRTALRLLREAIARKHLRERWILGLELVPSQYQPALDAYGAGEIDDTELLTEIRYHEEWGFPWVNYFPLFDWAKRNSVRLIALNRPKDLRIWHREEAAKEDRDLQERDRWAAGILADHLKAAAGADAAFKAFVLYGELHVSSSHLPAELKELVRVRTLTVHQNHESLYWKAIAMEKPFETTVIELKKDRLCVLNAPPWMKLQSLIEWAEGDYKTHTGAIGGDPDGDDDHDDAETHEIDPLSEFTRNVDRMSAFFGLNAPDLGSVTLRSVGDADLLKDDLDEIGLNRGLKALMMALMKRNFRFFLRSRDNPALGYLGTFSSNGLLDLAAAHLHSARFKTTTFWIENESETERAIVEAASQAFLTLILNPKRRFDLPKDLKRATKGSEDESPNDKNAKALALAWIRDEDKWISAVRRGDAPPERGLAEFKPIERFLACQIYGKILGLRLHGAFLEGKFSKEDLADRIFKPTIRPRGLLLELSLLAETSSVERTQELTKSSVL